MADDLEKAAKSVNDLRKEHVAFSVQMKKEDASLKTLTKALITFTKSTNVAKAKTDAQRNALKKYNTSLDIGTKAYTDSIAEKFKEVNVIEQMNNVSLEGHLTELNELQERVDASQEADKKIFASYKARVQYETDARKAEINIIRAEEEGMLGMMKARYQKMGLEIKKFARQWLGVKFATSKTSKSLEKVGGVIGAIALIAGVTVDAFRESTKLGSKAFVDFGGLLGKGTRDLEYAANATHQSMLGLVGDGFKTLDSVMENFNNAVENGALRMASAQNDYGTALGASRVELVKNTLQEVTSMKKLGTAVFGMTDFMPQTLKMMKFYGTRMGKQMNTLMLEMSYIGSKQLEIGAGVMLDTMNVLGESLYMTGTTAESVIPSLLTLGEKFKGLTKNKEDIKALFDVFSEAIRGVSIEEQMALAPSRAGMTYGQQILAAQAESKAVTLKRRAEMFRGTGEKVGSEAEAAVAARAMGLQGEPAIKFMQALLATPLSEMTGSNEQILEQMKAAGMTDTDALEQGKKILQANVSFEEELMNVIKAKSKEIVGAIKEIALSIPGINKARIEDAFEKLAKLSNDAKNNKAATQGGLR